MGGFDTVLRSLLLAALSLALPSDEVFTGADHDAALAEAQRVGRMLVIAFVDADALPCQLMERNVFSDERVRAFLGEHSVALRVDVTAQPELATRYAVTRLPTVLAWNGTAEVDRFSGYRTADALLRWLAWAAEGKPEPDEPRPTELQGQERYLRARLDAARGRWDDALDEYLRLWSYSPLEMPSLMGIRVSYLATDMGALAQRYEPASLAVRAAFDEAEVRLGDGEGFALMDWMALGRALGLQQHQVEWTLGHLDAQGRLRIYEGSPGFADLLSLMVSGGQPAAAGRMTDDLVGFIRDKVALLATPAVQQDPEQVAGLTASTHALTQQLRSAARAAARHDQAGRLEALLLEHFDSPATRLAMLRCAQDADALDERHARWAAGLLQEADALDPEARDLAQAVVDRFRTAGPRDG